MQVRYIGSPGDPDFIDQFGFTFERKGPAVKVPDDHRFAPIFIGNPFFECKGKGIVDFTPATPIPEAPIEGIRIPPEKPAVG